MKIRKVFKGSVVSNSRHVYTDGKGQHIYETSRVEIDKVGESYLSNYLTVDGLLPAGTKFTFTLEEEEE